MLTSTFVHLPGIGERSERSLWQQGCVDWDCFLSGSRFSVGSASKKLLRHEIERSKESLDEGNHQFFSKRLRARHTWRAYKAFEAARVFLDIETDGPFEEGNVTCIGLYSGTGYVCLQRGEDLESFRDLISHYSMIVTFCGAGFDLPILLKQFPGLSFDQIHLDLCPWLRRLGFRGGLKSIEKEFGIRRSQETDGLTGYDAVKLWRAASRGNEAALKLFIQYNKEDTVNMRALADAAFGLAMRSLSL